MTLNYNVQGAVNYTVVGTPTIVDGVASGFSADDYFTLGFLPETDVTKYVYGVKFTLGTLGATQAILSYRAGGPGGITITTDGYIRYDVARYVEATGSTFSVTSTNAYQEGETISAEGFYKGNNTFGLVIKNASGVVVENVENTVPSNRTLQPIQVNDAGFYTAIGRLYPSGVSVWYCTGSIDLNHTYITVNGQAWFGVCPVEVKHLVYRTPVDYEVVGSPTISNGVVSGFSNTDNIRVSQGLHLTVPFEMVVDLKYSSASSTQYIFSGTGISCNVKYKVITFIIQDNDSVSHSIVVTSNASYDVDNFIKCSYDGTKITTAHSLDGQNYTPGEELVMTPYERYSQIYFGRRTNNNPFSGSINFNFTYIKSGGKLWFFHPATNYLVKDDKLVFADSGLYLTGPNTYEVVGTPTIVDNVASRFGNSNYLKTPEFSPGSSTWEIVYKIRTGSSIEISKGIVTGLGDTDSVAPCYVDTNGEFTYFLSSNGSSWDIANKKTFLTPQINTDYTIKLEFTGTEYNAYSLESGSWVLKSTTSSSVPIYGGVPLVFGNNRGTGNAFNGYIDLNNTYIKVNGSLWFYGKNYATQNIAPVPAGLTYGNTTTTDVGYVDMTTQAFTPAPTGATLGKDE